MLPFPRTPQTPHDPPATSIQYPSAYGLTSLPLHLPTHSHPMSLRKQMERDGSLTRGDARTIKGTPPKRCKILDLDTTVEDFIGNQNIFTFTMGVRIFNVKYQMGLSFLVSTGLLDNTVSALANFLFKSQGLYKSAIGNILVDANYQEHVKLLDLYMAKFNFKGVRIIEGLRILFRKCIIPFSIPAIDLLTKSFAKYYFIHNPGNIYIYIYILVAGMSNEEATHHIAFSSILLDFERYKYTSMRKQEFMNLTRGLNDGENFNKQFLYDIYEKVRKNPILNLEILLKELKVIEDLKSRLFAHKVPAMLFKSGSKMQSGE